MDLKRKVMTGITVASLAALISTGTFAWTSLNSQIINVWRGIGASPRNMPGGTLHDDHQDSEESKQLYVENWGDDDIFVRIRLSEYMEVGSGAGLKSLETNPLTGTVIHNPDNKALSLIELANIDKPDTWEIHIPKLSMPGECDTKADFHSYWEWRMGGWKYYYPAPEGGRETKEYVDTNSPDDLTEDSVNDYGVHAKLTNDAQVLTMAQWMDYDSLIGNYWVIDTDGWAYWASPIKPGEATGLLMNKVTLKNKPDQDYYYGVNVIAQMVTNDGAEPDAVGYLDNFWSFAYPRNGGWTVNGNALMALITGNEGIYFDPTNDDDKKPSPTGTITPTPAQTITYTVTPTPVPAITDTTTPTPVPDITDNITPTSDPTITITPTPASPSPKVVNAVTNKNSIISINETMKNTWQVTFTITEIYDNGKTENTEHTIEIDKNSDGRIDLGDYVLIYDIKGNGSNIKTFEIQMK